MSSPLRVTLNLLPKNVLELDGHGAGAVDHAGGDHLPRGGGVYGRAGGRGVVLPGVELEDAQGRVHAVAPQREIGRAHV